MSVIYRSQFSTLWITLEANETLGILDSDYLEDYYGNDGQVTLHHVDSATDYPVLMVEQVAETPEIPHDVFRGQANLTGLPDGNYQVRGRCRDVVGHYTILSSVQTPFGGELVIALGFEIRAGQGFFYQPFPAGTLAASVAARKLRRPEITGGELTRPTLHRGRLSRPTLHATLAAALTR